VTIDLEALNRLPHDENVFNQLQRIAETEAPPDNPGPNHLNEDKDPNSTLATNGFVPQLGSSETERTALASGLNVTEIVLTQPQLNPRPINEHDQNLRYMIETFPVLFPTGAADFHEQRRKELKVTAPEYFAHLIQYQDGRFAKDPRFRYFALNSIMRWDAKTRSRIFATHKVGDRRMTIGITKSILITDPRRHTRSFGRRQCESLGRSDCTFRSNSTRYAALLGEQTE
jgi:hypothetical protein